MTDRDTCKEAALDYNAIRERKRAEREELVERVMRATAGLRSGSESAARAAIAAYEAHIERDAVSLEAQCAAIRAALIKYGKHNQCCLQSNKDYGDPDATCTCGIGAALSPNAGEKVLDVVRALDKRTAGMMQPSTGIDWAPHLVAIGFEKAVDAQRLCDAIAALGRKP